MAHLKKKTFQAVAMITLVLSLLILQNPASGAELPSSRVYWVGEDSLRLGVPDRLPPSEQPALAKSENLLSYLGSTLWTVAIDSKVYDTALIVRSMSGLQIFNIANVSNPLLVGQVPIPYCTSYNLMQISGHYLYVGGSNHLYIYDISDPFNPALLSERILEGLLLEIQASGNRAYVGVARFSGETKGETGFYILDVSNPAQPQTIGKYSPQSSYKDCRHFVIVGNYAYTVNHWGQRVEIINLADETRPVYAGSIDMAYPVDIAYQDGYLYIDKHYDTTMVYSLPDPLSPLLHKSYFTDYAEVLEFHNGKLYTLKYDNLGDSGSVRVFNVYSPGNIAYMGRVLTRVEWYSIDFYNNYLIVPEAMAGFSIFNIADPGNITTSAVYSYVDYALGGVAVRGNYAYLPNRWSFIGLPILNRGYVVDITDRHDPKLVRSVDGAGGDNEYISDSLLFVNGGPVNIFSISDPINPVKLSHFPVNPAQIMHTISRDTILYACGYGYFWTGSLANPASPQLLDSVSLPGIYQSSSLLYGNIAYVAGYDFFSFPTTTYLTTYDVSNPRDIKLIDHSFLTECQLTQPELMARRGAYIYLANQSCGVSVIKITSPTSPEFVRDLTTLGEVCNDVDVKREYLIATCYSSLQVYRLDDPESPTLVQYIPLSSFPLQGVVDGDYLYLSTWNGFYIYQLNLPPIACGDANSDGNTNISDAVFLITYIFAGGLAPDPLQLGDANCDGMVNISDAVYLITYIFSHGPAPCGACQ